ncbi:MAG: SDR family oxidoreductase [Candidatus Promineofilum sp.]|uniref:SDR family oxidoreductase n=1 Tax=Promineifilum sp. TaxID=2664178 RepID=UPI001DCA0076|nr:SDR family oxidoreductase [Caldilineaceae bacterium]MCB9138513.1 SDR family oxidoreductase [Caldilineaceae bacterium]MCO5182293.1 SDR family oxidoreductase [Promineifilum sp.]
MRLQDKVSIITGGGRGIGRATAMRFAEEGAVVVVADIELDVAQETCDEINGLYPAQNGQMAVGGNGHSVVAPALRSMAVQVNVADMESVEALVQSVMDRYGRIDVIVNNAGIVRDAQLVKMSEKQFDQVIDVNLKGVFNCSKAVAPIMVAQGSGVILNASSIVAFYGNFGQTNYVAAKSAVVGMTKVWARELGRKGVRVNAVAPGFIKTRMTDGIPDQVMDALRTRIPMGDRGNPEDIANAYLFLASDEAAYVNGHVLAVDGGATI